MACGILPGIQKRVKKINGKADSAIKKAKIQNTKELPVRREGNIVIV